MYNETAEILRKLNEFEVKNRFGEGLGLVPLLDVQKLIEDFEVILMNRFDKEKNTNEFY